MSIFAKKLKELRKKLRYNQTDFAESIGSSRSTISACESGAHQPSIALLEAIAKRYGVSTDWLLGLSYAMTLSPDKEEAYNAGWQDGWQTGFDNCIADMTAILRERGVKA